MRTGTDSDAKAFIDALNGDTTPLTSVQRHAINYLVNGLKINSLWTKLVSIYPFVGGTEFKHKWNLKDPRDLNAAYRLVFNGSWTHGSSGIKGNVINTYANTHLPQNFNGNYLIAMGYYSYENVTGPTNQYVIEMGARNGLASLQEMSLSIRHDNAAAAGLTAGTLGGSVIPITSANTVANTSGLFSISRLSTSDVTLFGRDKLLANSSTIETASPISASIYIGGINQVGYSANYFSPRGCALAYISQALTETEITRLSFICDNYQSILSRNPFRS